MVRPAAAQDTAQASGIEYRKTVCPFCAVGCTLCAEVCSTRALLAGDEEIISDIFSERVVRRGYSSGAWGWDTAYESSRSSLASGEDAS